MRNSLRILLKTGILTAVLTFGLWCPAPARGDSSFR